MLLLRVLSGWWWDAAVWRGQCQVPRLVALASPFFFWLEATVPVACPFSHSENGSRRDVEIPQTSFVVHRRPVIRRVASPGHELARGSGVWRTPPRPRLLGLGLRL